LQLIFHPETIEEVNHSIEWYDEKQEGLGQRFKAEVLNSIEVIGETPLVWPKQFYGAHRYLLKHFPYGIFYTVGETHIAIIAVAHLNRKPNYWAQRIMGT
jgi:hypothetical protein